MSALYFQNSEAVTSSPPCLTYSLEKILQNPNEILFIYLFIMVFKCLFPKSDGSLKFHTLERKLKYQFLSAILKTPFPPCPSWCAVSVPYFCPLAQYVHVAVVLPVSLLTLTPQMDSSSRTETNPLFSYSAPDQTYRML